MNLVQTVELFISCQKLRNMDMLSKSDPCVVVYEGFPQNTPISSPQFRWKEIGRTEIISNNLNPSFSKTFQLPFRFEEIQPLKFLVVDIDNQTSSVEDDDQIGQLITTLGEIAGSSHSKMDKEIRHPRTGIVGGHITVRLEQINTAITDILHLHVRGIKLAKKDLFSSDPYYILKKKAADGTWVNLYTSEILKKNLNPVFNPFFLPLNKVLTGNSSFGDLYLRFEVWDWDQFTAHDLIGTTELTLHELVNQPNLVKSLENPKHKSNNGSISFEKTHIEKQFTFLDFIQNGCEMNMILSIDFTGSNGVPTDPRSLHYFNPYDPNALNEYVRVIRGIGEILCYYDADKLFPVYGFGAMMPNGAVSHCFPLQPENPFVYGIEGMLEAYKAAIFKYQLYGPTYFGPTIREATRVAKEANVNQTNQKYFVLVIITDGEINDMEETMDAIVEASAYPMSIVIVGVGAADFSRMEVLDSDTQKLKSPKSGKYALRDIVQFVPFREFVNREYTELGKATLAEVPNQLVEAMRIQSIKPNTIN